MTESHQSLEGEQPLDVLIIGAGISGINAAYHLQTQLPQYRFSILEARDNIGGTWDLFRYPGIRSDSDLYTFGFSWHGWNRSNPIAEGPDILEYLDDAATTYRLKDHILFNHRVSSLQWAENKWTAEVQHAGADKTLRARFIVFGTGYYDYHQPLSTVIPGIDHFEGQVIHPQFWPESLDYTDKRVVVIGSGATAVTLIPKLAERAELVTMLQRSPSYIAAVPNPAQNPWWARLLPKSCVYYIRRSFRLIFGRILFRYCLAFPGAARSFFERRAKAQLPADIPLDPHFKPRYNPWEQRLCASPDGDFFKALASRKATVQTDTISTIDAHGIHLSSGTYLPADMIVTATGLKLQMFGGIPITVNGKPLDIPQKFMWNGLMLQDLPNAFLSLGYVNASWTLGADAAMQLTCRILKLLEKSGHAAIVPVRDGAQTTDGKPMMSLSSTYLVRAQKDMPRTAAVRPWVARMDYFSDMFFGRFGDITAGLRFL